MVEEPSGAVPKAVWVGGLQPPFFALWQAITRKYDGKVWQPDERINRVWALKMWTSWASDYVMKGHKIGTLEVGKLADMIIIDRDYLTVSEDDILKIRPLMTMLGETLGCSSNLWRKSLAWTRRACPTPLTMTTLLTSEVPWAISRCSTTIFHSRGAQTWALYKPLIKLALWAHICAPLLAFIKFM